jgi:hypothetical protein
VVRHRRWRDGVRDLRALKWGLRAGAIWSFRDWIFELVHLDQPVHELLLPEPSVAYRADLMSINTGVMFACYGLLTGEVIP